MKNVFAIGFAFLLGAATGVSIALLNAPYSGEKTRKKIREGFAETRSRAEGAFSDAQARAKGKVEDIQSRAQNIVHEIGEQVQPRVDNLKAAVAR